MLKTVKESCRSTFCEPAKFASLCRTLTKPFEDCRQGSFLESACNRPLEDGYEQYLAPAVARATKLQIWMAALRLSCLAMISDMIIRYEMI